MDPMSSPDPLNASAEGSIASSTRRVTRSQTSQRLLSNAGTSPRKQMFTLDIGSGVSPQKILVTVEAGNAGSASVSRRLFESPTPRRSARRQVKAVTTTVPLRGFTDDEGASATGDSTPRRKARLPKAGTPAVVRRRRAPTPMHTSGSRQSRRLRANQEEDTSASDMSAEGSQATPRPLTRTATSTKRKATTPATGEIGDSSVMRKRGRRSMPPLAEETRIHASVEGVDDGGVEDNASVTRTDDRVSVADAPPPDDLEYGSGADGRVPVAHAEDGAWFPGSLPPANSDDSAGEEDIWMATLSDPPAAARHRQSPRQAHVRSELPELPRPQEQSNPQSGAAQSEGDEAPSQLSMGWGSNDVGDAHSMAEGSEDPGSKDTVMLGEEFTMISVGSLPSMQPNASMAAAQSQEDMGDETSLIISRTLESVRRSFHGAGNRPSEPAPEEPTASENPPASRGAAPVLSRSMSPRAAPKSPRRAKQQPLGRQLALKALRREHEQLPPRQMSEVLVPSQMAPEETSMYEDSFSEIPEAVLDAVTPKPLRRLAAEDESGPEHSLQAEHSVQAEYSVQPSVEAPATVAPSDPQSESKLLTPDDTSSQDGMGAAEKREDGPEASRSPAGSEIRSSPPEIDLSGRGIPELAGQRARHGSSETPLAQGPSPRQDPLMENMEAHANLVLDDNALRPTLSPIVRAGRALQLVTSDPPSPPRRGSILGSPFKASHGRPSQSPTDPSPAAQPALPGALPALPVALPALPAAPPQRPSPAQRSREHNLAPPSHPRDPVPQSIRSSSSQVPHASAMEDPFGPYAEDAVSTDVYQASRTEAGDGQHVREESVTSSRADRSNNPETSWQAGGSPSILPSAAPSGMTSPSDRGGEGSPEVLDAGADMELSLIEFPEAPVREMDEEAEQAEDEDDIWAFEAKRPTPGRPASVVAKAPVLDPPRRSELQSAWMRDDAHLAYIDGPREPPRLGNGAPRKLDSEFSLLSQPDYSATSARPERDGRGAAAAPTATNLSAFFSPPSHLPGARPPAIDPSRAGESHRPFSSQPPPPISKPWLQAPRPLHQLPQPQFQASQPEPPTRPNPLLRPDAVRLQPRQAEPTTSAFWNSTFPPANRPRAGVFSPVRRLPSREEEEEAAMPPATPEPDRSQFGHVPQKRNFTPRLRQLGSMLFKPIIGTRPAASPKQVRLATPSDPETEEDERAPAKESSARAELKPLPSRAMSPTKSCMRSPLKPKTPGRVVEFASDALSPLAQAQTRAERRSSASPERPARGPAVPAAAPAGAGGDPPSRSPAEPPALSQTRWTRAHWARLDELLQQRRRTGPPQFRLRNLGGGGGRRGPASAALLGKLVAAQGQTMALERWHLDVVEAFRAEVGGWDEPALAKRLFALMVGEERRRRGELPARRAARLG